MIRRTLNIGYYKFLTEYYNVNKDNITIHKKQFVMIRNFNIMNDIINDTEIYIMDVNDWKEMVKEYDSDENNYFPNISSIAFPISSNNVTGFSNTPTDFNSNISKLSLYKKNDNNDYEYGSDVYPLLDSNGNTKDIKCDVIRIYHPMIKKSLKYLICIDNYINNIHFYYLCKPNYLYETNSETEIKSNNQIYSEYIEIYFPNLDDLFKVNSTNENIDIYNVYFNENLNTVVSKKNEKFIEQILSNNGEEETYTKFSNDNNGYLIFKEQLVPLNLLLQPYRIAEDVDPFTGELHNVKLYLKQYMSMENNYLTNPFNLIVFPYDSIDENTHQYLLMDGYSSVELTYITEHKFTINSKIGFDDKHKISLISEFDFPNKELFIENNNNNLQKALLEAYKYYYNVDEDNYKYYWVNKLRIDYPDIVDELLADFKNFCSENNINQNDEYSDNEKLRIMIEYNYKYNDEGIYDMLRDPEVEEEFETGMNFIGFRIQMATDLHYKNLIYNQTFTIKLEELDNFLFNLNGLFGSWVEYPDFLIVRTIFIDRIENIYISSNNVVITKEMFKYMINDNNYYTIDLLNIENNNMIELKGDNIINPITILNNYTESIKNLISENISDSNKLKKLKSSIDNEYKKQILNNLNNLSKFNFINNINCIINNSNSNENNSINKINESKIIFKPIFYKTQDLQNVRLRSGVKQKIGINLVNYMTKVDTFKLNIDGIEFVENSRNDIYVIFEINSAIFTSSSGTYNITNQDDEYISSGNWILY